MSVVGLRQQRVEPQEKEVAAVKQHRRQLGFDRLVIDPGILLLAEFTAGKLKIPTFFRGGGPPLN